MQTVNSSPFQTEVLRIDVRRPEIAAVAIVKSTFDVDPAGKLAIAAEQVPLIKQALLTPFGVFHSEYFFKKRGADLCVLGTVRRARAVEEARVRLSAGARSWELMVRGDRRWQRTAGARDRLVPSRPQPFTELPLGYSHAFGGQIAAGELTAGYAANPRGRGYYRTAAEAEHQPLPNIEDPAAGLLSVWHPEERSPAGWGPYPNFWGLRAEAAVGRDAKTNEITSLSPALFNHAHPSLILDQARPGEDVVLEGMQEGQAGHGGSVYFRIPAPPAVVRVEIGDEARVVDAPIDGLFLWVDERKLVVTQRARFLYPRRPEELRTVHVQVAAA